MGGGDRTKEGGKERWEEVELSKHEKKEKRA